MNNIKGKNIQLFLAYISFILSGSFIFSPLHKAENILISLAVAFATGFICIYFIVKHFPSADSNTPKNKSVYALFSCFAAIPAVFSSLVLLTEVIKDVAYVANRGVSMLYYASLALAALLVSFYLCHGSKSGILRFNTIAVIPFAFLSIIILTCFLSVKGIVFNPSVGKSDIVLPSVLTGVISGLFFASDSTLFLFCFDKHIRNNEGRLPAKPLIFGYCIFFLLITVYNTVAFLIFGSHLTKTLSDPDYALTKLIPGIDLTEMISTVRIISFIIKSSVYLCCSSEALSKALGRSQKARKYFLLFQYITLPVIFLSSGLINKELGYGAYQHLIYPAVIIMSIAFYIIALLSQKKKE